MKSREYPSKEKLLVIFRYDANTGILYRKLKKSEKACSTITSGYLSTRIEGERYLVHILIFIMLNGYQPEIVEHKDTNKLNNLPDNLRPATYSQNNSNVGIKTNNTSGFKGVYRHGSNWRTQIYCQGKRYTKSGFKTPEEANEYLIILRRQLHGEFARDY